MQTERELGPIQDDVDADVEDPDEDPVLEDGMHPDDDEEIPDVLHDNESDRVYELENVGRAVKGLYTNGWFDGIIKYYNKVLDEYVIEYTEKSLDYVHLADFDGVDLKFC